MFPDQFLVMKNMLRKIGISLLMLLPICASRVILVHVACTSHALLMHAACADPIIIALHLRRSYTPKIFRPMTRTMILVP